MNLKKIKILVFIVSFILISLLLSFIDFSKKLNYYNINKSYNDSLKVQIDFKKKLDLNKKEIRLYYTNFTNSPYSDDQSATTQIDNHSAKLNFFSKSIPLLFRINFDEHILDTIRIKKVTINLTNQKIDIDLTKFIAHPSIRLLRKKSDILTVDLSHINNSNYDPYIYLEKPIYVHRLTTLEIILIIIAITILSFLISELFIYLLFFKLTTNNINSTLLFLLIISLLFKEHWISKTMILIGVYTAFLFIKNKIKLKKINFYGYSLFFFFTIISLIWSVNIGSSMPKLIGFTPFIIIPIWASFLNLKINYEIIFKYVGMFFMLVAITTVLQAFFRYNSTFQMSEFYYHNLSSPLSTNAIYISVLYLIVFLFNLSFLLRKKGKTQTLDYLTLIVLLVYILLLSSKLIVVLLFLSTYFLFYSFLKLRFKKSILILVTLLTFGPFTLLIFLSENNIFKRFEKITNIEKIKEVYSQDEFGDNYLWNGLNLRLLQLRAFYDIEKNTNFNSFLGVGLNNGQELLNERYKYYKMYTGKKWENKGGYLSYNFHNQYAQTLIELGVVGFIFLVLIFFRLIINSKNNNNFLLFSIVFIFILVMFTESILVRQKGIMLFVLFPIIAIKVNNSKQIGLNN